MKKQCTSFLKKSGISALVLAAMLSSGVALKAQVTTVTAKVSAATDDMEEVVATGAIDFDSSDLEMTSEGAGVQILGFRFANLNIPAGAIITSAHVQFRADEVNTEATTLTIRGEAANNSVTFANAAFTVSSRPMTTASAQWSPASWTIIDERGAAQKTSDFKNVVQEVVGRSGWAANNALTIFITGTGKRVADSYEGSATNAAELIVQYVMPTTVSVRVNNGNDDAEENIASGAIDLTSSDLELTEDGANQYIAMRFNSLNIPKNATISRAYIQFSVDEAHSGTTNLVLHGQASDNAATYVATAGNISSRPFTTASVNWSPVPWTTLLQAGADQRTPDISPIIQEIIGRSGWNAFNSLAIRISGNGKRVAESYNVSTSRAPQLVVEYYTFERPQPPMGTFPVAKNSLWKYFDKGTDPGANWKDVNFNDSLWDFGPAELGYGDGNEATQVSFGTDANNKFPATYFRHMFNVASIPNMDSLVIALMRDDGAVVYLNGTEIVRSNMPAGNITYQTNASGTVDGGNESVYFNFSANKNLLVAGKNVLAVEIHQDRASSSDISFNLELKGKKNDVKLITAGTEWKYFDGGNPGDNWMQPTFGDIVWFKGRAPLGYGNGDEKTVIGFGPNAALKNITSYFRKSFNVTDTAGFKTLTLRLKRDDGAVVYLNGVELLRNNMPGGEITNTTLAGSYVEGAEEDEFITYYLNPALLKMGENVIAAEIHQNSQTSTDTRFDLDLTLQEGAQPFSPTGSNITCSGGDKIGCFTSVTPTPQQPTFNYPKGTHAFQVLMKSQRDRYTGTNELVPNGNDFTGFIPANMTSSTKGVLSVNHENTPGGVSLVDLEFDPLTALWKVPQIRKVDFSPVVRTVRNCSGGVTPWGTVITSEETYTTGDANADGYQDIGWNVEIDPVTGAIRDYNGDGKPDKLWAVGRMSHENVVVAKDSVTLYQGEDGGTGCVYKFVAFKKTRLDSGTLYVLKRDSPTSTTGTWVLMPNTTQSDRNMTSTLAGTLGTRFGGVEDVEISPKDGLVYFAEKGRGETWRFKDDGMTVSNLEIFLSNRMYPITHETGVTNEQWNTGNDNLDFDGEGNLYVLQDGGRDHIWVVRPEHTQANPKVELFATSPAGSEPTGITFSPDYRFLFMSFQNPSSTNTAVQYDAAGNAVTFNASTTVVVARKEHLGAGSLAPKIDLGPDLTICEGTFIQLKYDDKNAQNIWSDGSTETTRTITKSGQYILKAVGNNGKIDADTVRITFLPKPVVTLGEAQTICEGKKAVLKAPEGFKAYIWNDGGTGPIRQVSSAGTYSVIVYNEAGCTETASVQVFVKPSPQPQLANTAAICKGGETVLKAGDGFASYLWNNGATTPTLTVSEPGMYSVKLVNADGCEYLDSTKVTMTPDVTLGSDRTICEGGKTLLKVENYVDFAQYEWNTGAKTHMLEATQPGSYSLKMTTRDGCVSYDTITVSLAQVPALALGNDTTICENCTITLDAGAGFKNYQWNTGANTRTITVSTAGQYSVVAATDAGCTTSGEIEVTIQEPTGVTEIDAKSGISIYPNPFTTDITLSLELLKDEAVTVEIYEASGKKVANLFGKTLNAGKQSLNLSTESIALSKGVYVLKINISGREYVQTIVKD